jgi:hypothetical protein
MTSNFAPRNFWKQPMTRSICAAQMKLARNTRQQYAYTGGRHVPGRRARGISAYASPVISAGDGPAGEVAPTWWLLFADVGSRRSR